MKLKLAYSDFVSALKYASTVLSDSSLKSKVVIITASAEKVDITAYSPLAFMRVGLEAFDYEGEGTWQFQLNYEDLYHLLNSFSNLYKTQAVDIAFEDDGVKILTSVTEEAIDPDDSALAQIVKFYLTAVPIKKSISDEISTEYMGELEVVSSSALLMYLSSLIPLMANDANGSMVNQINFESDYVFIMKNNIAAFFKNKLPQAFEGISLRYSNVNILKKLAENYEDLDVGRDENSLYVQADNIQAFIRFVPNKYKYDKYVQDLSNEHGIVVDRKYFRNVLKRLSYTGTDATFSFEDGALLVCNDDFSQQVALNNSKGDIAGVVFSAPVNIILKMLVGDDNTFPEELFIYLKPGGTGYIVHMMDGSGAWFSSVQVRRSRDDTSSLSK